MTVLLERERELSDLRAALSDVGTGKGRAVAIAANAGLGKTRLLAEARAASDDEGLNLLTGRATELERDFPFSLVRQLFEPQVAALSPQEREAILDGATAAKGAIGLDPTARDSDDPFAVLHGLYWVTAALAERNPLLLAIDDAHWADAGSLDFLGFLLPRLEELPVLLVMTARPDEPASPIGLARILNDPVVHPLHPAPLSQVGTKALLEAELGQRSDPAFAASCHEASGGNPFLLCELARSLSEQGIESTAGQAKMIEGQAPERVARSVLVRLGRLSPEAASVARSLAILGDGSYVDLVGTLGGFDRDTTERAVDELRAAAILDNNPAPRFLHPLLRNAIYSEIPVGERSRSHARAAALLRERDAGPKLIATQLLASEARSDRAAAETLLAAGEQALGAGAPGSAIAYLTRALREPPPPELRAAILDPLLTASFRAADQAAFAAVEEDVRAEWERDPAIRSRWAIQLTMLMVLSGRFEEAASMLVKAVEVAAAEGDVESAYQMQAQLSTLAALVPSVPEVVIADVGDQIDPDSPTGRLVAAMEARAAVAHGTAVEVIDAAKRALGNDGSIFAEEPELAAASVAVLVLVLADEVEFAQRSAERALVIAQERGATPELMRARLLHGFVAWGRGDLITAEADMRQAIDLALLAGMMPFLLMATAPFVMVLIERDQLDLADAQLRAVGLSDGEIAPMSMAATLAMMRGYLRFERGEFESAVQDFELFSDESLTKRMGLGPAATLSPFTVRALMALGRDDEARALADEVMPWACRLGARSSIAHCKRAAAISRGGTVGIEQFEEAVALLDGSPRRLERVRALVDLGAALRHEGRRTDARAPLREAFELARRCGAARIARRAHDELEATGEKVRRYTPIGVESLTPSERRVADLAASGMTNRQIAQALFVTVKTVEAHLSAAYGKLDIDSRRQLPDALDGGSAAS